LFVLPLSGCRAAVSGFPTGTSLALSSASDEAVVSKKVTAAVKMIAVFRSGRFLITCVTACLKIIWISSVQCLAIKREEAKASSPVCQWSCLVTAYLGFGCRSIVRRVGIPLCSYHRCPADGGRLPTGGSPVKGYGCRITALETT